MPVQNETELVSFEGWTLRVRPAEVQPARILLLMHGFKGDETSMWIFARELPADYLMIAPRAPYPVVDGGFSWRPAQPAATDTHVPVAAHELDPVPSNDDYLNLLTVEMFDTAVKSVVQLVDTYGAQLGVNSTQFDMMGFSQGGIMTNLTTLRNPQRIRKAAILGAYLPRIADKLIAARPLAGKPFFVAHGTQDDKVPIELARRSIDLLEQAGATVTYCEGDVGHKVSAPCLRALRSFLQD
jgi:phospholipase/carboxylesterase